MKKTFLTLMFLLSFLSFVGAQHLPTNISSFLKIHFPKYEIKKYKFDDNDGTYKVSLNSGHQIRFDKNGNWTKVKGDYTPIPKSIIDLLPRSIIQYISNNYPRKVIIYIRRKTDKYVVELSNSIELEFDLTGNFSKKS